MWGVRTGSQHNFGPVAQACLRWTSLQGREFIPILLLQGTLQVSLTVLGQVPGTFPPNCNLAQLW